MDGEESYEQIRATFYVCLTRIETSVEEKTSKWQSSGSKLDLVLDYSPLTAIDEENIEAEADKAIGHIQEGKIKSFNQSLSKCPHVSAALFASSGPLGVDVYQACKVDKLDVTFCGARFSFSPTTDLAGGEKAGKKINFFPIIGCVES